METRTKPVELLRSVLEPLGRCLTKESAREILSLRAGAPARRRVERLAAKSDAGTLTPESEGVGPRDCTVIGVLHKLNRNIGVRSCDLVYRKLLSTLHACFDI